MRSKSVLDQIIEDESCQSIVLTSSDEKNFSQRIDVKWFTKSGVDVIIPFLPGMIAFVKKAISEHLFNEMLLSEKRVIATELEQHNVIVNACENRADLLTQAIDYAGTFNKQRPIFAELKKRKHKEEDPEYIEPLNLMMK